MDPNNCPSENQEAQPEPTKPARTRRIPSSELFAEAREVQIEHAGETYRLRMTKSGKLILTK